MEKLKKILLMALILLLPYHHQIISVLLSDFKVLKFWKELVIFLLVLITFIQIVSGKKKLKITRFETALILFIAVVFIYVCISDSMYQALYISRVYFMPMFLVPVVKYMDITFRDVKNALCMVMASTLVLCVWGIIQAQFLGDGFLVDMGYRTQRVRHMLKLKNEFYILGGGFMQRVVSTFAAPNTFGMYLSIVITVVMYLFKPLKINRKFAYITLFISALTLILTFSRTSWIACVAALTMNFIMFVKWDRAVKRKVALCVAGGFAAFILFDILILHSGIAMAGIRLIGNTVTGKDSSLIGHLSSWIESVVKVVKHPFGLGLGKNGPRAMLFIKKPNLTESSYFLMAYEVGILGAIVYYSSYIIAAVDSIRLYKKTENRNVIMILSVILIIGIGYLSLPFIQDFELLVFMYVIVSLQYNELVINRVEEKGITA